MRVKIPGIGVYQYLLPVLTAWAVRMGYDIPDTEAEYIDCYYTDEFKNNTTLGSHRYCHMNKSIIQIRPGMLTELSTWAHEFAHMIQALNLGKDWHTSYAQAEQDSGYWNSIYEVEAREAGIMAQVFETQGWLYWEVDYNHEGEYSVWPRPKPSKSRTWGISYEAYYDNRWYYVVDVWDSDYMRYWRPAEERLNAHIKLVLRLFVGYVNFNAVINMQQYAA